MTFDQQVVSGTQVGMLVVHTRVPTKGCGRVTHVLHVRNDSSHAICARRGACRVEWDIGNGHHEHSGREGHSTGANSSFSLALVALSARDAAAAKNRRPELAQAAANGEVLQVGKHAPPDIGTRVLERSFHRLCRLHDCNDVDMEKRRA